MQVIAIAFKNFVFLEANLNVQVARWTTVGAWFTVSGAANAHPIVDARRNFDFKRFLLFELALAAARGAGVGDDFAGTSAMRTRLLNTEKALAHLHRARALASSAGFGAGAFLGSRTTTGITLIPAWNANLCIFAGSCFFQGDFHRVA